MHPGCLTCLAFGLAVVNSLCEMGLRRPWCVPGAAVGQICCLLWPVTLYGMELGKGPGAGPCLWAQASDFLGGMGVPSEGGDCDYRLRSPESLGALKGGRRRGSLACSHMLSSPTMVTLLSSGGA